MIRFADPKSDIAFKKLFGDERHKDILIGFLNAILDLRDDHVIEDITLLNPYQAPKISLLKETNVDVKARTKGGVTFIVEMQVERQDYFAKRALYYTAKAYVGQIKRAGSYPTLNQVIFIGILNFKLFDSPAYLSRHLILNTQTYQQDIKDLEFNFIELPKFTKRETELETIIEKWVYFFQYAEDLTMIPKPLAESRELTEAFEVLEQFRWTEEELEYYESWQLREGGRLDAMQSAQREGFEQGLTLRRDGRKGSAPRSARLPNRCCAITRRWR